MADRIFYYQQSSVFSRSTQVLFEKKVRSATESVEVDIRAPDLCRIDFHFIDVPDVANRVTPRFTSAAGHLLFPAVPVEGPDVRQMYLLGHGQVVPAGVVGKITGTTEGPGQGVMVDYDLDITAIDQILARGVTGHLMVLLPETIIEMQHAGGAEITYSATITVGNLGS